MSTEMLAGLVAATGFWIIVAVAVVGGPTKLPNEVWVSTASDKVPSHPTLVRAADPTMTGAIGPKI
jgi:hypothetical protein